LIALLAPRAVIDDDEADGFHVDAV
jgi:hypothetical protein